MKRYILILLATVCNSHADTIDHYMNIVEQIPQMEMKADQQSQVWAKSSRTVLELTCDSIIDSLMISNEEAKKNGTPLFCPPQGTVISPEQLNLMIQNAYRANMSKTSDKNNMTVSQVALVSLKKKYPCAKNDEY